MLRVSDAHRIPPVVTSGLQFITSGDTDIVAIVNRPLEINEVIAVC